MKKVIKKYRSICVIGSALVFNLVSSSLVWHPEGQMFNSSPMSVTEWVCDIVGILVFLFGIMMMFFDIHLDEKRRIKEALLETNEEFKADKDSVLSFKATEENR